MQSGHHAYDVDYCCGLLPLGRKRPPHSSIPVGHTEDPAAAGSPASQYTGAQSNKNKPNVTPERMTRLLLWLVAIGQKAQPHSTQVLKATRAYEEWRNA